MKIKIFLISYVSLLVTSFSFCSHSKTLGKDETITSNDKEILVSNQAELNAAIAAAKPGDIIKMKDGIWTDVAIDFNAQASAAAKITLQAQTSGKVILNGSSTLIFSKPNLIVTGLLFKNRSYYKKEHIGCNF